MRLARTSAVAVVAFLGLLFALTLTNHPFSSQIHDAIRPFTPRRAQEQLKFDVVLNALLLVPLGFLLPLATRRRVRLMATVAVAVSVSGFIEVMQLLVFDRREPSWRDFFLNVGGAACGYLAWTVFDALRQRTSMRRRNDAVATTASSPTTTGTATATGTDAASRGGS